MSENSVSSHTRRNRGRPRKAVISSLIEKKKKNKVLINADTSLSDLKLQGTPSIKTSNRFTGLQRDVNTSTTNTPTNSSNDVNKKGYVPPIVVQGIKLTEITDILKANNIANYQIKLISVGIKITLFNNVCYDNLKKNLIEKKIEHFTYSNRNTVPLKVILTGLPQMTSLELKAELLIAGLLSEEIIEILPLKYDEKNHNIHKNINYLIKLDKTKIKIQELRKIKSLFNIIIRWYPHVNYRNGPTQCRRCQMYGHGTSHCGRVIRCLKCGGDHSADDCMLQVIKCANCHANHEANDKSCPNREKYVAIRQNISINRQINYYKSNTLTSNKAFNNFSKENVILNEKNFPAIKPRNSNSDFFKAFSTSQPTTSTSMRRNIPTASTDELFTIDELTSMVSEIIQQISVCKTRSQQFEVIMKLSLQYLGKSSLSQ